MGSRQHRLFKTLVVMGAMLGCNALDDPSTADDSDFPFDRVGGVPSRPGFGPIPTGVAGSGFGQPVAPPIAGMGPVPSRPPITNDLDAGDDDGGTLPCDPARCNCGHGRPECAGCEVIFCAIL